MTGAARNKFSNKWQDPLLEQSKLGQYFPGKKTGAGEETTFNTAARKKMSSKLKGTPRGINKHTIAPVGSLPVLGGESLNSRDLVF